MNTENHLIVEQHAALGVICLDRVSSLNALTLDMINGIRTQVETWQNDAGIQAILINPIAQKHFVQVVIFVIFMIVIKMVQMAIKAILSLNMTC